MALRAGPPARTQAPPPRRPMGQPQQQRRSKVNFQYVPSDPEALKKRAERKGGNYDSLFLPGFEAFVPAEGQNWVRILPPTWEGHDHFGYVVWVHSRIGPDEQSYLCLRKMLGEPCPVCETYEDCRRSQEPDEVAKKFRPGDRTIYYLIDRNARGQLVNLPQLWNASFTQDRDISGLARDPQTSAVYGIDDPDEGYDLTFTRIGKGLLTKYSAWNFSREKSSIARDQQTWDDIMQFVVDNPIPTTLQYYSYEHITAALSGVGTTNAEETTGTYDEPQQEEAAAPDQYEEQQYADGEETGEYPAEGEETAEDGQYAEEGGEGYAEEEQPAEEPAPVRNIRGAGRGPARIAEAEPVLRERPTRAAMPPARQPAPPQRQPVQRAAPPPAQRPPARLPAPPPRQAAPQRPPARGPATAKGFGGGTIAFTTIDAPPARGPAPAQRPPARQPAPAQRRGPMPRNLDDEVPF